MKKILPIILAVWPYIYLLGTLISDRSFAAVFLTVYVILTFVVYIWNIINACSYNQENSSYQLAFWNMLIKLIHIPFYLGTLLVGIFLMMIMVVPVFIMLSPFMMVVLFLNSLFLMVVSTTYGISALVGAKRNKMITTKFTVVNIILHVFFVTDVISSVIVFCKIKKAAKTNRP